MIILTKGRARCGAQQKGRYEMMKRWMKVLALTALMTALMLQGALAAEVIVDGRAMSEDDAYALGVELIGQGDYDGAMDAFMAVDEDGEAYGLGLYGLGYMFLNGLGVEQSEEHAQEVFETSADMGCVKALYMLGYRARHAEQPDIPAAIRWYTMAAEQGHAEAMLGLGIIYDQGLTGAEDDVFAAYWYERAIANGCTDAAYNLGSLYRDGEGVEQDRAKAMELYGVAMDGGSAKACEQLGYMLLLDGDTQQARTVFERGAQLGSEYCAERLAEMDAK